VNELPAGRVSQNVIAVCTQPKFMPDRVEDTLDYAKCPLRLREELPISVDHVAEGICIARIILLRKLRHEQYEVMMLRIGSSYIPRFLTGAGCYRA
jgi:hypothetical protein